MPFGKIIRPEMPARTVSRGVLRRPAPMPPPRMGAGYAKGGTVSRGAGAAQRGYDYKVYAKGGSVCRGMGSATKGGKYSIK